jgi:predicted unusual protein kinase regulating ubiquinone biosynthesis (AarF/ABC1/UbiB family)
MSLLAVPDLHFRRYRQIAEALTRHGLRWLRDASGLGRFRPLRFDMDEGDQVESLTAAVSVRLALEELGATFIKLGQFLSRAPTCCLLNIKPSWRSCRTPRRLLIRRWRKR